MRYAPSFLGRRPILSEADREALHAMDRAYPLQRFRADVRHYDEMAIDFVYTSAKIEGNTYDRLDTDTLLRVGVTAGGKRYSDATMLMNLRDAFAQVMVIEADEVFDADYVCDLHRLLMRGLLPSHEQGLVRNTGVQIGGSSYVPLEDAGRLRRDLRFLLDTASSYEDAFEQALYLHCNLAYLQYSRDGNKRTARLM